MHYCLFCRIIVLSNNVSANDLQIFQMKRQKSAQCNNKKPSLRPIQSLWCDYGGEVKSHALHAHSYTHSHAHTNWILFWWIHENAIVSYIFFALARHRHFHLHLHCRCLSTGYAYTTICVNVWMSWRAQWAICVPQPYNIVKAIIINWMRRQNEEEDFISILHWQKELNDSRPFS